MTEHKALPGKFVWFEFASNEPSKARVFYGEVFGWRVRTLPRGNDALDMICVDDTPIGGYAAPRKTDQPARWLGYVSVADVDAAALAATAQGGHIVEPPSDIPGVGRRARIADRDGAELCLFTTVGGDAPDRHLPAGHFCWNELHTTDPASALAFYEHVVGYRHHSVDMGLGGAYHLLSSGDVDRAGVTKHFASDVPPHWLPYVAVDDVDDAFARARRLGATMVFGPEDIPGIGRVGGFKDPLGAAIAVIKPLRRQSAHA